MADAYRLAHAHQLAGRYAQAEPIYRQILAALPGQVDTLTMLGVLLYQQRRYQEALAVLEQARAAAPERPQVHGYLGLVLRALGNNDAALDAYRRAETLGGADADLHNNLGNLLRAMGRPREAIISFEAALALRPDDATLLANLAMALVDLGDFAAAHQACRRSLALEPGRAPTHNEMGKIYRLQNMLAEAAASFEQAIALDPKLAMAHSNLAGIHKVHGKPADAAASYRRALDCDPHYAIGFSNMLFALQYSSLIDEEALFEEHLKFAERFEAPLKPQWQAHQNVRDPSRRLRVGYVSADFNQHAVAHFFLPVIEHHNRREIEVICYYNGTRHDDFTTRAIAAADHWVPCHALSEQQLAERIGADQVDILVDLSGHTAGNRLLTFARKPAPIQVSWLGYFGTSGLAAMDYRFTDAQMDPPGLADRTHTEQLVRLSHFAPFQPVANCPPVASLPALKSAVFMLASLNNLSKLSEPTVALWSRILQRLPQARLMLCNLGDGATGDRVQSMFAAHGIAPERLELQPWLPMLDYLALHQRIDLALDPFPYNGGTISNHALWMGVPVVTLAGRRSVGRIGASLMTRAGLADLVCTDEQTYLHRVLELASDLPRLANIRKGLRKHLAASPITAVAPLTREIEATYRQFWQRWCERGDSSIQEAKDQQHAALVAFQAGEFDSALAAMERAVTLTPNATWLVQFGHMLQNAGHLERAMAVYCQALVFEPRQAQAHCNIGNVLSRMGKPAESVKHYQAAIECDRAYVGAYQNLGHALRGMGRVDQALSQYRQALALNPTLPEIHNSIGIALRLQGKLDEAAAAYEQALRLHPGMIDATLNLANVEKEQKRYPAAIARLRGLLEREPDHALACNSLGAALVAQGEPEMALQQYQRAITLAPGMPEAHLNLGALWHELGALERAIECYRSALACAPQRTEAHSNLLFALSQLGDSPQARAAYLSQARSYGRQVAIAGVPPSWQLTTPGEGRPLRVGLVSGDLYEHPVGYFLLTVLAKLDPARVRVHAYSSTAIEDKMSAQLKAHCHGGWNSLAGVDDESAAQRIRADGIHVLLDLAGHTGANRLPLFARRPAPVQASWLGYWASTGVEAIDFVLADQRSTPLDSAADFVEELYYLPHTRLCFSAPVYAPDVVSPPVLGNGFVTFGCFQKLGKISDAVLATWLRVMLALPNARLVLRNSSLRQAGTRQAFAQRLVKAGFDMERVRLSEPLARRDYLASYGEVDILLDTFPYAGGTTTCEALWMGVPTLTLDGQSMLARQGASMLACAGLDQWIAADIEHYVALAVSHASDVAGLAQLRSSLREQVRTSPLFDADRFARDLEQALYGMWDQRMAALGVVPP